MKKYIMITFMVFCLQANSQKPVIEWITIPSVTFTMGSPSNEPERGYDETEHKVKLNTFRISKYEITVAQFEAFIDATGYLTDADKSTGFSEKLYLVGMKTGVNWKYNEHGNLRPIDDYSVYPVVHVSWNDAAAFAKWMSCRLPTEAEWEYACRANSSTPFNTGDNISTWEANYNGYFPYNNNIKGERRSSLTPVGSFSPNAWGLYDMHGNVSEWCNDWKSYYQNTLQINPKGPNEGKFKILRGGNWGVDAKYCRSASRSCDYAYNRDGKIGFRIVSQK